VRALVFNGEQLTFRDDHPEPTLRSGEAIVRPLLTGICSTDLEICRGYMGYRGVLGHEFVGVVEAVHAENRPAAEQWIGRRVVGEINCVCGACDMCRRDLSNHCRDRTVLGIVNRDGAFADRFALPIANLHAVPDHVSDEHAVFAEPLAAACNIPTQIDIASDDRVTVLGDGRLGLLCAQVLAMHSDNVCVVGKHASKLARCRGRGIGTAMRDDVEPAADRDIVVDCTGSAGGLEMALRLVRPRGTIVLKTTVAGQSGIDLAPLVIDEVTVVGSRCGPFADALRLLADGRVDVESLITDRHPLTDGVSAFEGARHTDAIKVLLTLD